MTGFGMVRIKQEGCTGACHSPTWKHHPLCDRYEPGPRDGDAIIELRKIAKVRLQEIYEREQQLKCIRKIIDPDY